MDSRIYFHQYRRPRCNNPTYASSNVQNSLSFFNGSMFNEPKTSRYPPNRYDFELPTSRPVAETPVDNYRPAEPRRSLPQVEAARQENSKLSNYGQRSLHLDQRGVYNKQSSKFDIINLKPKEHSDAIKQYPWLTVENRDDIYYKRMNQIYNARGQERSRTYEKNDSDGNVAGRHTYDLEPKIALNPERNGPPPRFTAKMLNHMDELQHNLA